MAKANIGLGKGIDNLGLHELISGMQEPVQMANRSSIDLEKHGLHFLSLDRLKPGQYQPRTSMDDDSLIELAQSIKTHGIIQPILVRPLNENSYEIVAGERRWRAAKLANLQTIPVLIKKMGDQVSAAIALIENIQRENLNIIDEAKGLAQLMSQFKLTHQSLAKIIGKSRSSITNTIRILDATEAVTSALEHKQLSMGHARALLSLSTEMQTEITNKIIDKDLSVRATESLVKKQTNNKVKTLPKKPIRFSTKEQDLAKKLSTNVIIKANSSGSGQIQIKFCSKNHLDTIFKLLNNS